MNIIENGIRYKLNTTSDWPHMVDLLVRKGLSEELLEKAKVDENIKIKVPDGTTEDLSAWGIPWRRS